MGYTKELLDNVRGQIAPDDEALKEARYRRDLVIGLAMSFTGVRRGYKAGSIAHGTANDPLSDADGGAVLDRRYYPKLGPDGENEGPTGLLEDMREFIGAPIREIYPNARLAILKRAIKVTFGAPIDNEQDPSVDLIVGLERKDADGLWIPNTEKETWDPSNPELHTAMILEANKATSYVFARVIRLAKAWNNQFTLRTLIPFNIEALALGCITEEKDLAVALQMLFDYAAKEIKRGNTPDPAGASAPIKLPANQTQDNAVRRLAKAAGAVQIALDNDDDETTVAQALNEVFWQYIGVPAGAGMKASLISALRSGNGAIRFGESITIGSGAVGRTVKDTRAYGEASPIEDRPQAQ